MRPKYLKSWRQRFQERFEDDKKRVELAKAELAKAIEILKQHGAKRIILFGSLREGHRFQDRSDIDLAEEGIAKQDFCRAYADLIMALNWRIDLKPLEEIEHSFKESILQRGEILYEK